jgi:hypothetical protein
VYHVPYFIFHFGSLRKFSGHPTEKINDNIKAVYHLKTNHHDCVVDAIKVQKRLDFGRSKRNYSKADHDFWEYRKQELHARKRRQILQEIDIANVTNTKKTFPKRERR